jgi:hypothetical protein
MWDKLCIQVVCAQVGRSAVRPEDFAIERISDGSRNESSLASERNINGRYSHPHRIIQSAAKRIDQPRAQAIVWSTTAALFSKNRIVGPLTM